MRILRFLAITLVLVLGGIWLAGWLGEPSGPHNFAAISEDRKREARDYLAGALVPLPEGWTFSTFERESGVQLRTGRIDVADAKGIVVLVPGHTAPLEVYGPYVKPLVEAGYSVTGLEQRSQGRSWRPLANPEKSHQKDYADLSADLAAYVASLGDDMPVFVIGNSMGGHIALRAAGENGMTPRALGLVVPMVDIVTGAFPYPVARFFTTFYTWTGQAEHYAMGSADWKLAEGPLGVASDCNPNPATAGTMNALRALDEPLRVEGVTNQWVHATMASASTIVASGFAEGIDVPTLMVTAGKEAYVSTPAAAAFCERMGSCERIDYPQAAHCIVNEDRARGAEIMAKLIAFFDARL